MPLSVQVLTLCNRAAEAERLANLDEADSIVLRIVGLAILCDAALNPFEFPMLAAEAS